MDFTLNVWGKFRLFSREMLDGISIANFVINITMVRGYITELRYLG